MCLVIHRKQPVNIDMRIFLRRRQAYVPRQFLDRPQVRSGIQHVGRKRMPDSVRAHLVQKPAAQDVFCLKLR